MKILIETYKNKYIQLKKAYDEVEHERDRIKVCRRTNPSN